MPEDPAKIIRLILRENGYSIDDDENVDPFLEFSSSSEHVELKDRYWLLLPSKPYRILVLSDLINELDGTALIGVKTYSYAKNSTIAESNLVDSLVINSDSIINVQAFNISNNNLLTIPNEIGKLRATRLDFGYNQIKTLPEKIMATTEPPVFYDKVVIYLQENSIDTTTLSDTLKSWLAVNAYEGPYWWQRQEQYK